MLLLIEKRWYFEIILDINLYINFFIIANIIANIYYFLTIKLLLIFLIFTNLRTRLGGIEKVCSTWRGLDGP